MKIDNKHIKISFDFDGVLELNHIQEYAKELVARKFEVWIVTSRFGDAELYKKFFSTTINVDLTNNDLWNVAKELGIPKEKIYFTNMADKYHFFKENEGFIWHLDDDWIENRNILNNTKTKGINSWGNSSWKQKCERILRNHKLNF